MAASTPEVLAPITLNLSPALGGYTTAAPQQRLPAVLPAYKRFKAASPADDFLRFLASPTGKLQAVPSQQLFAFRSRLQESVGSGLPGHWIRAPEMKHL